MNNLESLPEAAFFLYKDSHLPQLRYFYPLEKTSMSLPIPHSSTGREVLVPLIFYKHSEPMSTPLCV